MTCAEFEARLNAWLTGTLPEPDARALEAHASMCATCEARLDAVSRLPSLARNVPPPAPLRAAMLHRVHQRRIASRWQRAALTVAAIAAVALVAVTLGPARKSASIPPVAGPEMLATARARPEFDQLDAAEKEVEQALKDQPGDANLSTALARIRRQRDALRALVSQAKS